MKKLILIAIISLSVQAEELSYNQALANLSMASREVKATAQEHEILKQSVQKIYELVKKEQDQVKKGEKPKK